MPDAVPGVFGFQRGQYDFHSGRAGFLAENEGVDPRHDFIFEMNGALAIHNVVQADAYGAGVLMAVEPQAHLGDGRLAVGQRAFDFDAAATGALNIDGIELVRKRFAGLEFLFVLPDTIGMVKNILLQPFADELNHAGGVKRRAVGPAVGRNHPCALRVAGVG